MTQRSGFATGQLVPVFAPELGLSNAQLLVSQVDTQYIEQVSGPTPWYTVTMLEGADVGGWEHFFASGMRK
jgi:prophage tail gpP-like protein